ncbi:hypothetical protein [Verrucomicrobium sp. BvORR106]|uniref:hypothetical protein n=1 Tax=Verrucomicrobium sp. BvORR106 TaxID=1403819 RepID=UPI0005709A6D|nr:hypothetical protein [Verrucomicrobium sp. BvORR106]
MKSLRFTLRYAVTLSLLLISACAGPERAAHAGRTLVLKYKDFGPQAAAYELLGYEWPQWETQGSDDPSALSEISVVVYRGLPLEAVKQRYPVVPGQRDYRYVSYEQALSYCDRMLKEGGSILPHLKQTKRMIEADLAAP